MLVREMLREKEAESKRQRRLVRIVVMTAVMVEMEGRERVRNLCLRLSEWWTGALGWSFLLSVKAS